MKTQFLLRTARRLGGCLLGLALALASRAEVPGLINYQGRLIVGSTNYDGTAKLKFALVDGADATTYWSNDGTSVGGYQNFIGLNAVGGTIPGGWGNVVIGVTSFAAGHGATANHDGTFVWADGSGGTFISSAANQFNVRAGGGTRIFSNAGATVGVQLAPGGNSWSVLSDRSAKENFAAVNYRDLLDKLDAVPVTSWNLKSQDPSIRHIGPMAQEFHAAFAVGEDDRHISTSDADGVTFAVLKGLREMLKEKETEITALKSANAALADRLTALETQMRRVAAPRTDDDAGAGEVVAVNDSQVR